MPTNPLERPDSPMVQDSQDSNDDDQQRQEKLRATIMAAPTARIASKNSQKAMGPSIFGDNRWQSKPSQWQILCDADKTPTERIKWVIDDWVPDAELTLIVGPPNAGKNTLALTLAAGISQVRGFSYWSGAVPNGYGVSIISSTEENFARVTKKRFVAAGGNPAYLKKLSGVPAPHLSIPFYTRPSNFSDADNEIWMHETGKIANLGLLIFDPASQVIRGNSSNAKDREGHEKLARFAKELNCAVIGLAHTPKTTKGKSIYARIAGTGAVGQVARSIIMISEISRGPTYDGATHVMVLAKAYGKPVNYGVTFNIVGCTITEDDGQVYDTSKIVWCEIVPGTPDEVLKWADGSGEMATVGKTDPLTVAVDYLRSILIKGPRPCGDAKKLMAEAGITTRDRDRAKKQLGVVYYKGEGQGQFSLFYWRLPETPPGKA